jgi:hypothetical protein
MHKSVVFPRGGGGSWLSNLIFNLERGIDTQIDTKVGQVFDQTPRTKSMEFKHYFDLLPITREVVVYVDPDEPYLLFSTDCPFNLYLNDAIKVKLNTVFDTNIINAPLIDKFFEFGDSARYLLADPLYVQTYYQNIDINLRQVVDNPEQFAENLFGLLTKENIKYTPNKDYVIERCKQYTTTCPNPKDYVDNWDDLVWLAWVHAILSINNVNIEQDISKMNTIEQLQEVLVPFRDVALEKTAGLYFTWL